MNSKHNNSENEWHLNHWQDNVFSRTGNKEDRKVQKMLYILSTVFCFTVSMNCRSGHQNQECKLQAA